MSDSSTEILDPRTASALFANMVLQQTNMVLIFLGKTPNPETGEVMQDLHTAKLLIDQLEMLAIKTKGNLNENESHLMNESLAAVRMGFVEAVQHEPKISANKPSSPEPSPPSTREGDAKAAESSSAAVPEDAESRKKFSKKY